MWSLSRAFRLFKSATDIRCRQLLQRVHCAVQKSLTTKNDSIWIDDNLQSNYNLCLVSKLICLLNGLKQKCRWNHRFSFLLSFRHKIDLHLIRHKKKLPTLSVPLKDEIMSLSSVSGEYRYKWCNLHIQQTISRW